MPREVSRRYKVCERVRVGTAKPRTHHRAPGYIKGKPGRVVAIQGTYPDPQLRAYGGDGQPHLPLYMVEFLQADVWPEYPGPANDKLLIDVYQDWLEPA